MGIILLLSGCIGLGFCLNQKRRENITELHKFIHMFQLLKSDISYRADPLPDACAHAGRRIQGRLGEMLQMIAERTQENRTCEFGELWKNCCDNYFLTSSLSREEQKYIRNFPSYIGFSDSLMQITVMDEFLCTLQRKCSEYESRYVEQKKITACLSIAGGMILTILLL